MSVSSLLAIDPGNVESGWAIIDTETYKPLSFNKTENYVLLAWLRSLVQDYEVETSVIEMIGHYGTGMSAGKTVFDTCIWIGYFSHELELCTGDSVERIMRATVKTHLTGQANAKDGNVVQALVDRFAADTPNRGKGHKASPGWFYGFAKDAWQAYALAVYKADQLRGK